MRNRCVLIVQMGVLCGTGHIAAQAPTAGRSFGVVRQLVIGAEGSVDPAGLDFR